MNYLLYHIFKFRARNVVNESFLRQTLVITIRVRNELRQETVVVGPPRLQDLRPGAAVVTPFLPSPPPLFSLFYRTLGRSLGRDSRRRHFGLS